MSAALTYEEPYRFSAGVLALLVHLVFFALLYFGVHWQSRPNEEFMVDMWENLPNAEVVPEQHPAPPPPRMEPAPPAKVVAPVSPPAKAEIEMRQKKSRKAEPKEKPTRKELAKEKAAAKARQEADRKELEQYEAYSERIRKAEQERVRAEVSRAAQVQVERYQDMIRSKIRHKIVKMDVPDTTEVVFKVTLLPDGMLMDDPVLIKSSGIAAYDENVARAIMASEPLPVPADPSLQKMFRELKLSIRP